MERETQEKKRLSMENEELHWKMRQSLDHSGMMSMSVIEGDFKIYDLLNIVLFHAKSFP